MLAEPLVITATCAPGESSHLNSLSRALPSSPKHRSFSGPAFSSQRKLFNTPKADLRTPDGFHLLVCDDFLTLPLP